MGDDHDPATNQYLEATLEDKVAFLRRPEAYPDRPSSVEPIETHMSWVFLTDRFAYKLKKPVRYDFLDFSTTDARREDSRREVTLNRRLAPEVYLGVAPLIADASGGLHVDGAGGDDGEAVDWLVHMRRLPADDFLDRAIRAGTIDRAAMRQAIRRLSILYRDTRPAKMSPETYRARLRNFVEENHSAVAVAGSGVDVECAGRVAASLHRWIEEHDELLAARGREGRIVEGHGDLRPEHISLGPNPVIIDCLEFNREYRIVDPLDELSFLLMECDRLGAGELESDVLGVYRDVTGDEDDGSLIAFYKSHRALLRAKLAYWHTTDESVDRHDRWLERANNYLHRAEQCIRDASG